MPNTAEASRNANNDLQQPPQQHQPEQHDDTEHQPEQHDDNGHDHEHEHEPDEDPDQDLDLDEPVADVSNDDDDVLFFKDLAQLHSSVRAYVIKEALHDRILPDRLRKQLLRAYPPVEDFSVSAPQTDQAFASLAHTATLRRDRQLANITVLQLQALRPLLHIWSNLASSDDHTQSTRDVINGIKATIALSLHAVSTTTALRRQLVLSDINPALIKAIKQPAVPLFGSAVVERLQQLDEVERSVRRLQRPNEQRRRQPGGNNNNISSSNNSRNRSSSGPNGNYGRDQHRNNYNNSYNNNQQQQRRSYNNNSSSSSNSSGKGSSQPAPR